MATQLAILFSINFSLLICVKCLKVLDMDFGAKPINIDSNAENFGKRLTQNGVMNPALPWHYKSLSKSVSLIVATSS